MPHLKLKLESGRTVDINGAMLGEVHAAVDSCGSQTDVENMLNTFAETVLEQRKDQAGLDARDVSSIISLVRPVPAEVVTKRLEICGACPHSRKISAPVDLGLRCLKCGCLMSLKARLAFSRCPIGQFEAH